MQGITEISFPRLGCGNGNLDWVDVQPVMEHYLAKLPISIFIHDFTVDIGLPEHLECVAETLRGERTVNSSFAGFMRTVRRAVDLAGSEMVELESKAPFSASMPSEEYLEIEASGACWRYELDDLRGVWLKLQKGIVTMKDAGWSIRDGSRPLLTLFSLLPNVRPIQI